MNWTGMGGDLMGFDDARGPPPDTSAYAELYVDKECVAGEPELRR